jgi:hypothetical protein
MSQGYVSNCPISMPVALRGINPDVDLNGLAFSYQWGMFYVTTVEETPLRLPVL